MIIHKLIRHHLKSGDDEAFYALQARDAIQWMEKRGVALGPGVLVLDLGCGHGVFGAELLKRGCSAVFADESNWLMPDIPGAPFRKIDLDRDDLGALGAYDLVVCSNVLEHLSRPCEFIRSAGTLLKPGGRIYLSWTNWLSPWGGHEFSPFHYLGARRGHLVWDKLVKRPRKHTPFVNLFPTSIGKTLSWIRSAPELRVVARAPRYYPELRFIVWVPFLREFLTWNCALLIQRQA